MLVSGGPLGVEVRLGSMTSSRCNPGKCTSGGEDSLRTERGMLAVYATWLRMRRETREVHLMSCGKAESGLVGVLSFRDYIVKSL